MTPTENNKPAFDYKEPNRGPHAYFGIQAIVKRPDGSHIRPCAMVANPMEASHFSTPETILPLVLKNYDQIKESTLIKAWLETTTVTTVTNHHEIKLP